MTYWILEVINDLLFKILFNYRFPLLWIYLTTFCSILLAFPNFTQQVMAVARLVSVICLPGAPGLISTLVEFQVLPLCASFWRFIVILGLYLKLDRFFVIDLLINFKRGSKSKSYKMDMKLFDLLIYWVHCFLND